MRGCGWGGAGRHACGGHVFVCVCVEGEHGVCVCVWVGGCGEHVGVRGVGGGACVELCQQNCVSV